MNLDLNVPMEHHLDPIPQEAEQVVPQLENNVQNPDSALLQTDLLEDNTNPTFELVMKFRPVGTESVIVSYQNRANKRFPFVQPQYSQAGNNSRDLEHLGWNYRTIRT